MWSRRVSRENQYLFHLAQAGQPRLLATLTGLFALLLVAGVFLWISGGPQPPRGFSTWAVGDASAPGDSRGTVASAPASDELAEARAPTGNEDTPSGAPEAAAAAPESGEPPREPQGAPAAGGQTAGSPPPALAPEPLESAPIAEAPVPTAVAPAPAPPTAVPTPVPPPPTPQVRRSVTLAAGLRMREAPSTSSAVIETLPAGLALDVLEGSVVADGFRWARIRTPTGQGGWVVEDGIQ